MTLFVPFFLDSFVSFSYDSNIAPDTGGEGGGSPPEKNKETKTEDAEAMKAELEALRKEKAEREKKAEEERQARINDPIIP